MSERTDHELLAAARDGDRGALAELIERHQGRIYRFSLRMCRDPEDAKDVLQDTLLAMVRGLGDFRGASSLSTWLYTVARSFCLKKRRRGKFHPERITSLDTAVGPVAAGLADAARAPEDTLASKQVERALERAIGSLEPMYREVLLLRDVEGLTAPEVAEVLGVSVQAVKSRLHRARLSVREQLAPLLGMPGVPAAPGACPDVLMLLSQHLEGEIDADVCAEAERHLAGCPRCRGACDSLRRTLALCRTAGSRGKVPAAVQARVKVALRHLLADGR